MVDEKKVLVGLFFLVLAIFVLSLNPNFTGYSIAENKVNPEVAISDALAGSTIKYTLPLELNTDTLAQGSILVTGDVKDWVSLVEESYVFLPGVDTDVPIYIHIPEGTTDGVYHAKLALLSEDDSGKSSALSQQIIFYIPITITVSTKVKEGVSVQDFKVYDSEKSQNVFFSATIQNEGNENIDPYVHISLYDQKGQKVAERVLKEHLVGYETLSLSSFFSEDLSQGDYSVQIAAEDATKTSTFSLVREGDAKKNGKIISSTVLVDTNSLVTSTVYFQNTGESVLSVALHGDISQNGESVQSFSTESQDVLPGAYATFRFAYTDTIEGKYTAHMEVGSDNVVLAEEDTDFYSSNAIGLETNVVVIFSLILLLLLVSHYMLSRRKNE